MAVQVHHHPDNDPSHPAVQAVVAAMIMAVSEGRLPKGDEMYTPSQRVTEQIDKSFRYHAPKGSQQQRYEKLRSDIRALAMTIVCNTPESREQSLALTKLEEVMMIANAAIARNETWEGNKMLAPLQLEFEPAAA
jgi:hypothetical protein